MTRTYTHDTCRLDGTAISTAGLAVAGHERGKIHIAALRAKGRTEEADRLQREADVALRNRRCARMTPAERNAYLAQPLAAQVARDGRSALPIVTLLDNS